MYQSDPDIITIMFVCSNLTKAKVYEASILTPIVPFLASLRHGMSTNFSEACP